MHYNCDMLSGLFCLFFCYLLYTLPKQLFNLIDTALMTLTFHSYCLLEKYTTSMGFS